MRVDLVDFLTSKLQSQAVFSQLLSDYVPLHESKAVALMEMCSPYMGTVSIFFLIEFLCGDILLEID